MKILEKVSVPDTDDGRRLLHHHLVVELDEGTFKIIWTVDESGLCFDSLITEVETP